MKVILAVIVGLFIGYNLGWRIAHLMVAEECERLGGFFVGKKTYMCHLEEEKPK